MRSGSVGRMAAAQFAKHAIREVQTRCCVQMLVDDIGDVTITNDGATILKLLEVEQPAAKVTAQPLHLFAANGSHRQPFACSMLRLHGWSCLVLNGTDGLRRHRGSRLRHCHPSVAKHISMGYHSMI